VTTRLTAGFMATSPSGAIALDLSARCVSFVGEVVKLRRIAGATPVRRANGDFATKPTANGKIS